MSTVGNMRKAGVGSDAVPSARRFRFGRGFMSILQWVDVRITSETQMGDIPKHHLRHQHDGNY
jgi:hypothetical protein